MIDEEIYWKHKSRADWLKEGDKNTVFLFKSLNLEEKKKQNKIKGIETEQGNWTKDEREVENEFCNYFAGLLSLRILPMNNWKLL